MPAAVILFKFNFIKVFIVSCAGGIGGTIFYVYLSAALLKWWDNYKEKKQIFKKKKIFTKGNRRIIRIKNRFGLQGIAILTPVLLSIPLGAFVAERFYKDKRKVITYISIWVVIWSVAFYFIYYLFYDNLKGWLF
ncbi:MAG: hypothetical protein K0S12_1663 [Bacteroidetes bacterium]|nr:hypothetical protein [Bacteroidota bacterium]